MTRFSFLVLTMALSFLSGCAQITGIFDRVRAPGSGGAANTPEGIAPAPSAPIPLTGANTPEALDTVTEEQRIAATAAPATEVRSLGEQTASLGDPTEAGIWMRTSLVPSRQSGRVEITGTGRSANVELIPLEGEGGAQLSLSAMRLLEVPLTDLPTVAVFSE